MSRLPALCQNWVRQRDLFQEWVPMTSKGDWQSLPQYVWVLSSRGVSLCSRGHSGPCRVSCVNGGCFGARLLLGPCLQPSSVSSYPSRLRCKEDPSRALRCHLRTMWLYVKGPNAHTLWPLIPSHLPCRLIPNGTKLGVSCWDGLKWGDSGWPCCDIWADRRTQPPQSGPVAWFVHV